MMTKPIGPYSPVVRAGDFLFVSGQVGVVDGQIVPGGVAAETRQALENLRTVLAAEGASLDDVVKTTVFLRHMRDFNLMNDAYSEVMGHSRPARSTVAVVELPVVALVEIDAVAYKPGA
jgi:2-iminobutanoate/2-iminopropanoate deaminase